MGKRTCTPKLTLSSYEHREPPTLASKKKTQASERAPDNSRYQDVQPDFAPVRQVDERLIFLSQEGECRVDRGVVRYACSSSEVNAFVQDKSLASQTYRQGTLPPAPSSSPFR